MMLYNVAKIEAARRDQGLTQAAIARALKKSRPTIIKVFQGRCNDLAPLWAVVDLVKLNRADVV